MKTDATSETLANDGSAGKTAKRWAAPAPSERLPATGSPEWDSPEWKAKLAAAEVWAKEHLAQQGTARADATTAIAVELVAGAPSAASVPRATADADGPNVDDGRSIRRVVPLRPGVSCQIEFPPDLDASDVVGVLLPALEAIVSRGPAERASDWIKYPLTFRLDVRPFNQWLPDDLSRDDVRTIVRAFDEYAATTADSRAPGEALLTLFERLLKIESASCAMRD